MSRSLFKKLLELFMPFGIFLQRHYVALDLLDKSKDTVLDVGCGDGYMSRFLVRCGRTVVGIDVDRKKITKEFPFVLADAKALPFKMASFNQVVCLDVLEHVRDDGAVAEEIERILAADGTAVITAPTNSWRFPFHAFMKAISPSEKSLLKHFGHVRKGYTIDQIEKLFKKCRIVRTEHFVNDMSSLFYDLEYSRLVVIKNIILRVLAPLLFLNFKLVKRDSGFFFGVELKKV